MSITEISTRETIAQDAGIKAEKDNIVVATELSVIRSGDGVGEMFSIGDDGNGDGDEESVHWGNLSRPYYKV